jgi:hypothetical protein
MPASASNRDLAFAGVFGAAGLLLPFIFHVIHLGHIFMPMYIPLVALGFLVRPGTAAATGFIVPVLSAALTGMPPLYPPVAPIMAIELSLIAGTVAVVSRHAPSLSIWILLPAVLITGRFINAGLSYFAAWVMDLPAGYIAGISFVAGWPGILLMLIIIPPVIRSVQRFTT